MSKKEEIQTPELTDLEVIPVVMSSGRYRLYKKPDGMIRIQFREDSATDDAFFEFPAALLAMAKNAAEGNLNPMTMMKDVAKLMTGMDKLCGAWFTGLYFLS